MMESSKTPIYLDDVQDRLTALGVWTICLSKAYGKKREYLIQCVTSDGFEKASRWCKRMSPHFHDFKLIPFQVTEAQFRGDE